jgi:hypothetical protein
VASRRQPVFILGGHSLRLSTIHRSTLFLHDLKPMGIEIDFGIFSEFQNVDSPQVPPNDAYREYVQPSLIEIKQVRVER